MAIPKGKVKFPLWAHPETLESVREFYKQDDCKSQSEFIEKAIRFYVGYISAEGTDHYLPNAFLSTMKSIAAESDNRQGRMLFKLAVEMAMMMNVIAYANNLDDETLLRLRKSCVEEVKRINGTLHYEDAVAWQRG